MVTFKQPSPIKRLSCRPGVKPHFGFGLFRFDLVLGELTLAVLSVHCSYTGIACDDAAVCYESQIEFLP